MAQNVCPHCDHGTVYCINSRPSSAPGIMRRRTYECEECKQRFTTEETVVQVQGAEVTLTLRHRAAIFSEEVQALLEKHFGKFASVKSAAHGAALMGGRNVADED